MDNNIGEARRSYAALNGKFTQDDAARFFGVAPSTYKGWEQGTGKLNGDILCKIADKYDCSVDYLLCRVKDPTPYPKRIAKTEEERKLLDAFRDCSDSDRGVVSAVAAAISR